MEISFDAFCIQRLNPPGFEGQHLNASRFCYDTRSLSLATTTGQFFCISLGGMCVFCVSADDVRTRKKNSNSKKNKREKRI